MRNAMNSQTTPLRVLRQRRALSLGELAARSGISVATLWRAEVARSRPYPRTRRRIAAALGVDPALLVAEPAGDAWGGA